MTKGAIVLISGGLDSATAASFAKSEGFDIYGLTVNYGQRHSCELRAAERVAEFIEAKEHKTVNIDLDSIGGSALTDNIDVPKNRDEAKISSGIPVTYVPARNTVFLSVALGYAEARGLSDIFIGVTAVDYSGYPDCRREFIDEFERLAVLATKQGVEGGSFKVHTPLIDLSKKDIIKLGLDLGMDYSITHSCYDPQGEGIACGECDSCLIRKKAFLDCGLSDTVEYI